MSVGSTNGSATGDRQIALHESEQSFRQAFDEAPIGLALVSTDGRFLRVNNSLAELVGYRPEELLEMDFQQLTHPDDLDLDLEYVRQTLAGERRSYEMEKRYLHAEGHVVWILLSVSLLRDPDGEPVHFVSQIQDISGSKALEHRLTYLASHDEMTGLANRRRFDEDLRRLVAHSVRYRRPAALLLIDLDNFKEINDTLGHAVGDKLVTAVATRLKERLRETDLIARVGGDEFAIVLPESSAEVAAHLASQLVTEIAGEPFVIGGAELWARASVGVAYLDPAHVAGPAELLIQADQAMYRAKDDGGNGIALARQTREAQPD